MERNDGPETFADAKLIDIDINALRKEFRDLRRARRLSQKEVADILKVSQATVSALEKGRYGTMRKKSLMGVWKLVQFWKHDSNAIIKGDFANRSIVAIPRGSESVDSGPVECPSCHERIPEHDPPFRYCPFCTKALGLICECGNAILDEEANFCSRCGRALIPEGKDPYPYPSLRRKNESLRLRLLRSVLNWLDKGGAADSVLPALEGSQAGGSEEPRRG